MLASSSAAGLVSRPDVPPPHALLSLRHGPEDLWVELPHQVALAQLEAFGDGRHR